MVKNRDLISSLFWIGVGTLFCLWALKYGFMRLGTPGAGFFPFITGIILISLSSIIFISSLPFKKRKGDVEFGEKFFPQKDSLKKILFALVALFAYGVVLKYLGFLLATFLFMIFLLRYIEPQRWTTVLTASLLTSIASHIVFKLWLKVQLPAGILGI